MRTSTAFRGIRFEATPEQSNQKPATPPPIRPTVAFATAKDVEDEMALAEAKATSLYERAKTESNRPLSDEERLSVKRFQEYYSYLKAEELPAAQKLEEMQRDALDRTFREKGDRNHRLTVTTQTSQQQFGVARGQVVTPIKTNLKAFTKTAFAGDARAAHDAAVDSGHWLRAYLFGDRKSREYCQDRPHLRLDRYDDRMDAQTVDDTTRGGVLVPEIVSRTIIDVRDRYSLIASIARQYPMQSETDLVPKRTAGLTVYKPGEDAQITSSEKQFTNVSLSATDAYTLTHISHKLMRGSVVDAADQVVNEIGHAFAKQQDYEGLLGDGTSGSPDFGILGAVNGASAFSNVAGAANWDVDTAAKITAYMGKFAAMVAKLPDRFHDDACWVCSRAFWANVIEPCLEAAGGNTKYGLAQATPYMLKGYPVKFSEHMPTAYATTEVPILFGNFYQAILLGQREQVGIATSEHHRFDYDQITIRGRMAYDIKFHEKGDVTNAGAIIKLTSA